MKSANKRNVIDPKEFYAQYLEEHNRRIARMRAGDAVKAGELKNTING